MAEGKVQRGRQQDSTSNIQMEALYKQTQDGYDAIMALTNKFTDDFAKKQKEATTTILSSWEGLANGSQAQIKKTIEKAIKGSDKLLDEQKTLLTGALKSFKETITTENLNDVLKDFQISDTITSKNKQAINDQLRRYEQYAFQIQSKKAEMEVLDEKLIKAKQQRTEQIYHQASILNRAEMSEAQQAAAEKERLSLREEELQLKLQQAYIKKLDNRKNYLKQKEKEGTISDEEMSELDNLDRDTKALKEEHKKQTKENRQKTAANDEALEEAAAKAAADRTKARQVQATAAKDVNNQVIQESTFVLDNTSWLKARFSKGEKSVRDTAYAEYEERRDSARAAADSAAAAVVAKEKEKREMEALQKADFVAKQTEGLEGQDKKDKEKEILEALKKGEKGNPHVEAFNAQYGDEQTEMNAQLADLVEKSNIANDIADDAKDADLEAAKRQEDGLEKVYKGILSQASAIQEIADTFTSYKSAIDARLQSSDHSFNTILDKIQKNVGLSTIVTQKDVLKEISTLVSSGIAYDVELRGFISAIKDDMVQTFDVTNAALDRIIRAQQEDSTAQRLGMEAILLKLLNKQFENSEYLSDKFDSIQSDLLETLSTMDAEQATEFEYQVQKWLGALYSLGMSESTVENLAKGINYLGTGDIQALNNDEGLQTLFAMSANQAGLPYASLLTEGLNASNINLLLKSMIEYLADIAQQVEDNNVVAKAYTEVLGLNYSDLTAIKNITSDIDTIYSSSISYEGAEKEYLDQAKSIIFRRSIAQTISTLIENVKETTASTLADDPVLYSVLAITNYIKSFGANEDGDIEIPFLNAFGFGIDLNAGIIDLIQTGVLGVSLVTGMLKNFYSGGKYGTSFDLGSWGYEKVAQRGGDSPLGEEGVDSDTSQSEDWMSTTNSSGDDLENSTLSSANENAKETSEIVNEGATSERTFDDLRDALFEESNEPLPVKIIPGDGDLITLTDLYESLFYNRVPVLTQAVDSSLSLFDYGNSPELTNIVSSVISSVTGDIIGDTNTSISSLLASVYGEVTDNTRLTSLLGGSGLGGLIKFLLGFLNLDYTSEWSSGMAKMYLSNTTASNFNYNLTGEFLQQLLSEDLESLTASDIEDILKDATGSKSSGGSGSSSRSSSSGGGNSSGGSGYSSGSGGSSSSGGTGSSYSKGSGTGSGANGYQEGSNSTNGGSGTYSGVQGTSAEGSTEEDYANSGAEADNSLISNINDIVNNQESIISYLTGLPSFMASVSNALISKGILDEINELTVDEIETVSEGTRKTADQIRTVSEQAIKTVENSESTTNKVISLAEVLSGLTNSVQNITTTFNSDVFLDKFADRAAQVSNTTTNSVGTIFRQVYADADYSTNNYSVTLDPNTGAELIQTLTKLRSETTQNVKVVNDSLKVSLDQLPAGIETKINNLITEKLGQLLTTAIRDGLNFSDDKQGSETSLIQLLQDIEKHTKDTVYNTDEIETTVKNYSSRMNI